jgi:UDP-glucose 4-epimerase
LTLKEEAETIAKVFWGENTEPKIVFLPKKSNHVDSFVYDISKAKRELDWRPQYSFEDILMDYIKEDDSNKFGYLLEKRKALLKNG